MNEISTTVNENERLRFSGPLFSSMDPSSAGPLFWSARPAKIDPPKNPSAHRSLERQAPGWA